MSSYWAGYSGQGLVLTESEFKVFLKNYKEKCQNKKSLADIKEWEDDDIVLDEVTFISHKGNEFGIDYAGDDNTEGFCLIPYRVNHKPNDDWERNEDIPFNNVYVISCDNDIDGMHCFEQRSYESYEDFVDEFKDKMDFCLSDDFDWDSHIGIFSYACYA